VYDEDEDEEDTFFGTTLEHKGQKLTMPFVVVDANGGEYDDMAFAAGWQLGYLAHELSLRRLASAEALLFTDSLPQVDLIAMMFGYSTFVASSDETWSQVMFKRYKDDM